MNAGLHQAPAYLYVWDDRFLWASQSFKGAMTHRYATSVIVAIESKPLLLTLPGGPAKPCAVAICAAGAKRCVDATDTPFLGLGLDPGTPEARVLEQRVSDQSVLSVERSLLSRCDAAMLGALEGRLNGAEARQLGDDIVLALAGPSACVAEIDPRVRHIADSLRSSLPFDVDVDRFARELSLSPTHLMHLFSQQMGLPMTRFLLWHKLRKTLSMMRQGQSLTEIAHACRFADSSHLTRTFKSFYGIKPSTLMDRRYVQVRHCQEQ